MPKENPKEPLLEREERWIQRIKDLKEALRDPEVAKADKVSFHQELRKTVNRLGRSYYEGTPAAYRGDRLLAIV